MDIPALAEQARHERALTGVLAERIVNDLIAGRTVDQSRYDRYVLQRGSAELAEAELEEATL